MKYFKQVPPADIIVIINCTGFNFLLQVKLSKEEPSLCSRSAFDKLPGSEKEQVVRQELELVQQQLEEERQHAARLQGRIQDASGPVLENITLDSQPLNLEFLLKLILRYYVITAVEKCFCGNISCWICFGQHIWKPSPDSSYVFNGLLDFLCLLVYVGFFPFIWLINHSFYIQGFIY